MIQSRFGNGARIEKLARYQYFSFVLSDNSSIRFLARFQHFRSCMVCFKIIVSLHVQNHRVMAPKKTATKKPTTTKPRRKKRGLVGIFAGKIHYKDDSIFNLD